MKTIIITFVFFHQTLLLTQDIVNPDILPKRIQEVDTLINSIKDVINSQYKISKVLDENLNEVFDSSIKKLNENILETYKNQSRKEKDVRLLWGLFGGDVIKKDFWGTGEEKPKSVLITSSTSDVRGSIYTDLVTDYLGILKVTFAASITASKSDTTSADKEKDDIQSFFAGGGNAILKFDLPIFYWSNLSSPDPQNFNTRSLALYFMPRLSMTLPSLGSSLKEPSGLGELGFEFQFRLLTAKRFIGISGRIRYGYVLSSSELASSLVNDGTNNFQYGVGSVVLNIKNFGIYINFPISITFDKSKSRNYPIDRAPVSISLSQIF